MGQNSSRVTNAALNERIIALEQKVTDLDSRFVSKLDDVLAAIRELRDSQIELRTTMSEVKKSVDTHTDILDGQNHGMNRDGLVTLVKGHGSAIRSMKEEMSDIKEKMDIPEKTFWKIMYEVLKYAAIAISAAFIAKMHF